MHLNYPIQLVTDVKICTNITARGHENMERAEGVISTLENVMKGYKFGELRGCLELK
jgi:hypothetical protein